MAHRAPVKGLRQRKEDRTRAPSTLIPTKHTRQIILFDGLLDSSILQNDLVAISGRYGNIQVLEAHLLRKKAQEGNHGLLT